MRRFRIKGRFYVILLALIAVAVFFIARPFFSGGTDTEVIMAASSNYTHTMDALIIRDEKLFTAGSISRIEYIARENTLVDAGDTICYLYSTGYSENELTKLETARENIQAYHKTLLDNIIDSDLEHLDLIVSDQAQIFKNLVTHKSSGNLITVTRSLETAMVNRQEYMRSNMRGDLKLNKLYSDESARLGSISSWRVEKTTDEAGVVSFYTDGYEESLNLETIDSLTIAQVKNAIAGIVPTPTAARETPIYRTVNQDKWYVALLSVQTTWVPVVDQEYAVIFDGFEDIAYNARVSAVSQSAGEVLAVFEINDPIGPLIYKRALKARISTTLTGLSVSNDAIYQQNDQTGVWLYDVEGGTFVPVTVLQSDGTRSLIEPIEEGVLSAGQRVLIK